MRLACTSLLCSLLFTGSASAETAGASLPAYRGRIDLFTLTPRGDVDGFVLDDGTEVKTPPHLSGLVAGGLGRGDAVTVWGLKAAAKPLVEAATIADETKGATVTLFGQPPRAPGAEGERSAAPVPRRVAGRIRLVLHGARGEANGVLLADGTIVRLPPPDAARLARLLTPGQEAVVDGWLHSFSMGAVLEATAIGPSPDRLGAIGPNKGDVRR